MTDLDPAPQAVVEAVEPRRAPIGESTTVSRYFPRRGRATVGAWCFVDYYGPDDVDGRPGMRVGPHPHTGLQTVTWLLAGEVVHRDSLGNVQPIRPGQLNLMTAGSGIAHAELSPDPHPRWLHGVQLWVALPDAHRHVPAAFEHHADLPVADLGAAQATVLVGDLAGARSAATTYSALVGADVRVAGPDRAALPLQPDFEHALLVVDGAVTVDGSRPLPAGACVYLGRSRTGLSVAGDPAGRFLLLGGQPFTEPLVMWWNFVGRTTDDIAQARADWESGDRFGEVAGRPDGRVPAPPLPPGQLRPR
ncbi:MAG TPA: pirin family protein [Acidimicrobiales bacterium]|nr:pirin family protein [Acidimicrobiales bacterium]